MIADVNKFISICIVDFRLEIALTSLYDGGDHLSEVPSS